MAHKQQTAEARYASTLEGMGEALRSNIHLRLSTYCRICGTSYSGMLSWMKENGHSVSELRRKVQEETEGWGSLPSGAPSFVPVTNGPMDGASSALDPSLLPDSSITFPDGTVVRLSRASGVDIVRMLEIYRMRTASIPGEGDGDV